MLARRHRLSVYDASYLELARRDGISLATLDNALVAAAPSVGVTISGFRAPRCDQPDHTR